MTTPANGFGLDRIRQISVVVHDVPRAVAYYRDVLGMRFLFDAGPDLAFFDCGGSRVVHTVAADSTHPDHTLYSFGGGLRYTVGSYFSLRCDVGFPLTEKRIGSIEQSPRAHLGVLFSY